MKLIDRIKAWRIEFIDGAGKFYKLASVWVLFLIGCAPDAYNGIAAMGWLEQVPEQFTWIIRGLASIGIVVRVVKQRSAGQAGA